jgi:hypothetical protein
MNALENHRSNCPIPISTEEFDRKVEAGEDLDEHIDWEKAVMVAPDELSPGQKLSLMQAWLDDLLPRAEASSFPSPEQASLNIPFSPFVLVQIGQEALRHGVSREALVQSWVEQKVGEHKAAK